MLALNISPLKHIDIVAAVDAKLHKELNSVPEIPKSISAP